MDVVSADVALERTGDGFTLTNDQVQKTDGPAGVRHEALRRDDPGRCRSRTGPAQRAARSRIETPGKPTQPRRAPSGSSRPARAPREVVELEIKAKVPVHRRQDRRRLRRPGAPRAWTSSTASGGRGSGASADGQAGPPPPHLRRAAGRGGGDARRPGVPRGGLRAPAGAPGDRRGRAGGRRGGRRGTRVSVDQVQAARGIPSFATKFVGDEIHIVQRERGATTPRPTSPGPSPASPAR